MSIETELAQAASARNQFLKKQSKVAALVARDAGEAGVIDVVQNSDDYSCLVISSAGVHLVSPGMFGQGKIRSARFDAIRDVKMMDGYFSTYLFRDIRLETDSGTIEHRFLWYEPTGIAAQDEAHIRVAEAIRQEFANQILGHARPEVDEDRARFDRAMSLAESQPPVGSGDPGLGPDEITSLAKQWDQLFSEGQYQTIWARRLAYGYGVVLDATPTDVAFWFNALPAVSAVRLGVQEHPAAAMMAGTAEQMLDRSDAAQQSAMDEINRGFFG